MNTIFSPNILATKLSKKIVTENPSLLKNSDEIRYGLEWTFSGINQLLFVLILAFPLQVLPEATITLIAGAVLRMFSGGSHFKNYYLCLVFSTFQILFVALFCKYYPEFLTDKLPLLLIFLIISFIITVVRAPVLQKKKHLFSRRATILQKIYSIVTFIILISTSLLLPDPLMFSIWVAIIIQSLTLTFLWEKCIYFTDAFLYKNHKGER